MAKQPIVAAEQATQKVAARDMAPEGGPRQKVDEDFVYANDKAKKDQLEGRAKPSTPATWAAALGAGDDEAFKTLLARHLRTIIDKHGLSDYEILFLFDDDSISSYHSDRNAILQGPRPSRGYRAGASTS